MRQSIVSFKTKVEEGYLLRPRLTQGYPSVTIGREANRLYKQRKKRLWKYKNPGFSIEI